MNSDLLDIASGGDEILDLMDGACNVSDDMSVDPWVGKESAMRLILSKEEGLGPSYSCIFVGH